MGSPRKRWQFRRREKQERAKNRRACGIKNRESYGTMIRKQSKTSSSSVVDLSGFSNQSWESLRLCGLMVSKLTLPANSVSYRSSSLGSMISEKNAAGSQEWEALHESDTAF